MRMLSSIRRLFRLSPTVPTVLQAQATECGVAALTMLLAHFGRHAPLEELRRVTGVSRDGSNAKIMIAAARHYGVLLRTARVEPHELPERGLPLIAHMNFGHFVVVEAMDDRWVQYNDPSGGRCRVSVEDFDLKFTGVALVGTPLPGSKPTGKPVSLLDRLKPRLTPFGKIWIEGLTAGLFQTAAILIAVWLLHQQVDAALTGRGTASWLLFYLLIWLTLAGGWSALRLRSGLARFERRLMQAETRRLLRHLILLPHAFFAYRFPGHLHETAYACRNLAAQISTEGLRLAGALTAVLLILALFALHPVPAALVLLSAAVQVITAFALRRRAVLLLVEDETGDGPAYAAYHIERIETIKTGGMDVEYMAQVAGNHAHHLSRRQRRAVYDAWEQAVEHGAALMALIGILLIGAALHAEGDMTAGQIVAALLLTGWGMYGLRGIAGTAEGIRRLRDQVARVDDILQVAPDESSEVNPDRSDRWPAETPKAVGVDLKKVVFGYSRARPARLHEVDLHIRPGVILGITGPSGGGKSTIGGVIAGQHPPWSGTVEIEGCPVAEIPSDDRVRLVALADKSFFLFEGTMRENLRLWDESITDEMLMTAAGDAGLDEVLTQRGEGLDCRVMERGLNFSGGQRQRIEIARALARNPALLILDEANDALEVDLERRIMDRLRRRGCTVVVITHRTETLRRCDEVVVVEGGHIAAPPAPFVSHDGTDGAEQTSETPAVPEETEGPPDPKDEPSSVGADPVPLMQAFMLVVAASGLPADVEHSPSLSSGIQAVYDLARTHNLLIRRLRLIEKDWLRQDAGPLLGFYGEALRPVALLPVTGGGYRMHDPQAGTITPVTEAVADQLNEKTFMFYRRLPDEPLTPNDLRRFAFHGVRLDAVTVACCGVITLLLTAVWPVAAARLFSGDAPVSAIAAALLPTVVAAGGCLWIERVSLMRLFSRALHTAHTAIWDRMTRLPVPVIRRGRAETLGQMADGQERWFHRMEASFCDAIRALPGVTCLFVAAFLGPIWALFMIAFILPVLLATILTTRGIVRLETPRFERAIRTSAFLLDLIRSLRRLHSARNRWTLVEKWEGHLQEQMHIDIRIKRLGNIREALLDAYPLLAVAGFSGALLLDPGAVSTPARMAAMTMAFVLFTTVVRRAAEGATTFMIAQPMKKRGRSLLAEPTEAARLSTTPEKCDNRLTGAVDLHNITFRYTEFADPALKDVTIETTPGGLTVLSGPSGCGKSTLLRILPGYLIPQKGTVQFDGRPLSEWRLDVLRAQIGVVLQEDALWEGILRNNIAGMAPYTLDEVWAALQLVELAEDVDRMPRKINTFAGEATLSTGQMQRLVMARQLIRRPRLLILDEATSALDAPTEARIFSNLRRLGVTCICAAHRESTIAHADRVYRMEKGRVVRSA